MVFLSAVITSRWPVGASPSLVFFKNMRVFALLGVVL